LFPHTGWTQLAGAASNDPDQLDRLIRLYWAPLKVFLVASFPSLRDRADELLQNFSEDRILKEGWLKRADRTRGRFRDLLKSSLKNFVLDHLNKAENRNAPASLDDLGHEVAGPDSPSEQFDLAWTRTVLAEVLQRMETDCRDPDANQPRRTHIWEMFQIRILDPIFNNAESMPYEQLVNRFGLKTPTDASNMLLSGKRIFKAHITNVIEEYCEKDAATASEVRALEEFILSLAKRG